MNNEQIAKVSHVHAKKEKDYKLALDALTTQADELYRQLEGEAAPELVRYFDDMVDQLESMGGRVKGITYIK